MVNVFPRRPFYPVKFTGIEMYGKLEKSIECVLAKLHPLNLLNTIFCSVFWKKLFAIRFPHKHYNFWPLCLPINMVPKTVIRPIDFDRSHPLSYPFRMVSSPLPHAPYPLYVSLSSPSCHFTSAKIFHLTDYWVVPDTRSCRGNSFQGQIIVYLRHWPYSYNSPGPACSKAA